MGPAKGRDATRAVPGTATGWGTGRGERPNGRGPGRSMRVNRYAQWAAKLPVFSETLTRATKSVYTGRRDQVLEPNHMAGK